MSDNNDIIIIDDDDDEEDMDLDRNNNIQHELEGIEEMEDIIDVRYNGRELEYKIVWKESDDTTWEKDTSFIGEQSITDLIIFKFENLNKIGDILRRSLETEAIKAKENEQCYENPPYRPIELWEVRGKDYNRRIDMGFEIKLEHLKMRRYAYNSSKSTSLNNQKTRSAISNDIPSHLHIPVEMNGIINYEIDMKMGNDLKNLCPTMIDELSRTIWKIFNKKRQSISRLEDKLEAQDQFQSLLRSFFQYEIVPILAIGSTVYGSALKHSKMDLMLTKATFSTSEEEVIEVLEMIKNAWKTRLDFQELINKPHLVRGEEPSLNFVFRGKYSGIECNLIINNLDSFKDSCLFTLYSMVDVRFSVLTIIVKVWAEEYKLMDSKNHFLSGYTLMLMVTHFLQSGTYPQLLPNLQGMFPETFTTDASVQKLYHLPGMEQLLETRQKNNCSIGELLIQFFVYYSHFDFANYEIDCKNCRSSRRSSTNTPTALSVLDPITSKNTAKNVGHEQLAEIVARIQTAKRRIRSPSFRLKDIRVHA